jgi:hypothetical protein
MTTGGPTVNWKLPALWTSIVALSVVERVAIGTDVCARAQFGFFYCVGISQLCLAPLARFSRENSKDFPQIVALSLVWGALGLAGLVSLTDSDPTNYILPTAIVTYLVASCLIFRQGFQLSVGNGGDRQRMTYSGLVIHYGTRST